jgi:sugar phosphate permease
MKIDKRLAVTILAFLIYMLTNFHRPAVAVMGDQLIRDFGLTSVSFGFIGLIFMWTYALMQFPVGTLNDTWGPRKVLLTCLVITSAGALLFGVSHSYLVLVISRILVAVGISGFSASGAKLLAEWFDRKQFGKLWGSFMGWGVMGSVLATRPLVMLMNSVGWRISFEIIGLISVVILVLAYFVVDSPQDAKAPSPGETGNSVPASAKPKTSGWDNLKTAVTRPETWLVVLFFIGVNSSGQVLCALWGGVFLQTVYGFNENLIANILMVSAICMIFGSLFSGFVKPKTGMISGSFVFTAVWLVITFGMQSLSLPAVYIIFALIGFVQFWAVVAGFVFLRNVTPSGIYGTVYGVANGAAWILGAGAFQQIWGFILQNGADKIQAFQTAMGIQLVVLVLSCIAAVILAKRSNKIMADA